MTSSSPKVSKASSAQSVSLPAVDDAREEIRTEPIKTPTTLEPDLEAADFRIKITKKGKSYESEVVDKPDPMLEDVNMIQMFARRSSSGRKPRPAAWLAAAVGVEELEKTSKRLEECGEQLPPREVVSYDAEMERACEEEEAEMLREMNKKKGKDRIGPPVGSSPLFRATEKKKKPCTAKQRLAAKLKYLLLRGHSTTEEAVFAMDENVQSDGVGAADGQIASTSTANEEVCLLAKDRHSFVTCRYLDSLGENLIPIGSFELGTIPDTSSIENLGQLEDKQIILKVTEGADDSQIYCTARNEKKKRRKSYRPMLRAVAAIRLSGKGKKFLWPPIWLGSLGTKLLPYQEDAVNFMVHREMCPGLSHGELLRFVKLPTEPALFLFPCLGIFVRNIENVPIEPYFGGGILADEMGLGKTVEVLGLVLTHTRDSAPPALNEDLQEERPGPSQTRLSDLVFASATDPSEAPDLPPPRKRICVDGPLERDVGQSKGAISLCQLYRGK
ncbi:unnamed protein product [Nippostrongylus brasiliensis]|uniref:SNF2_N domain-containing protein n=1 Tax=Nippostrongylus brasiliensis TaxID=27835 RepID=A0A0N4Y267_NIPBR|nr:unnamed protein product [Nippostrongylus brasiliensis]